MADGSNRGEGDNVSIAYAGGGRTVPCYCLPFLNCGAGERGRWNVRAASAVCLPLFVLAFFLLDDAGHVLMRSMKLRSAHATLSEGEEASTTSMVQPIIKRKTLTETPGITREIMWAPLEHTMMDDDSTATMRCPKAILFLFHGCQRYAASFFYSPQGRKLVSMAHQRGVAIVSFEKTTPLGCWSWDADGEAVLAIGKKFLSDEIGACGVDSKGKETFPPLWAFGASSGGTFISMLASEMELEREKHAPFAFSAMNVQIMAPPQNLDWNIPTIFTVMDGDPRTKQMVKERVEEKSQFKMIATSGQKAIHAIHFAEAYPDDRQMSPAVSREIYDELAKRKVIDPSQGDVLTANPRQLADTVASIWEKYDVSVRKAANPGSKNEVLPFGVSHQLMEQLNAEEVQDANNIWLIEELNVAWDQHEITAEGFEDVLSFFFEHGIK